ncbi:MAG: translocation/assembly module TamB domain-containing protein [Candidatus Thiodiazotropha taylori]|nr:translocation/assembly module TamB domain-containing protein [Candidatus Thiodiazotropha taylori]MCW4246935.1 translocation/assembly module TamB domain-containing protein [Candidatus Thiodiazotropha endolucinida]MCG7887423.1 translocation/assembly module TamB domain-containing protein [Candidatus Thiodiazotropha taylori]MCG7890865.1 translocation/assembly module TamB domain-containing protein [Candidatus Thiodiazotropha taylori]MCG8031798.1 translocation/assembly module TamB domain-containin
MAPAYRRGAGAMTGETMKRVATYVTLSTLLILLLLSAIVYYFVFTHDGSRRSFYLAQRLVPGDLQVDILHGRLAGPLELTGLSYQQADGLAFRCERLYLDWRPSQLLGLRLEVSELSLVETRLRLPASEKPDDKTGDGSFQGVKLPLAVTLSRFSSEGFELVQGERGDPVRIDKLNLSAATEADRLAITQFDAEAFSSRLSLQGSLGLDAPLPMTIDLSWAHTLEEGPRLAGEGRVSGDLQRIEITQRLAPPFEGELQALLSDLQGRPEWNAVLKLKQGELGGFIPDFPASLKGQLSAQGSFEAIDLDADLELVESRIGEIVTELHADYNQGAIRIGDLRISNGQGLDLMAKGEYNPQGGELSADLQWRGLRWPLIGEKVDIGSDSGTLQLQGGLDAYVYQLAMQASRPEVGTLQFDAVGSGTLEQVDLDKLSIELQQGKIEGSGKLIWSPTLSWQLGLTGDGVDPALVHPMFPGNLAFDLDTKGSMEEGGPDAELNLNSLSGLLRDYSLNGKGRLTLKQDALTVHALELLSGSNRIAVDGSLADRLALKWSVDAPELASLWPGLSGALRAKGDLGGTLQAPSMKADIEAGELSLEAYRVGQMNGEVALEMAGEQRVALSLHSQELSAFGRQWKSLDIALQGHIPKHRLQIDLAGEQVPQLSLEGVSGLHEEQRLQGSLQRLQLSSPEVGEWELESALAYRLAASEQDVEPFCLVSGEARLCASFNQQAGGWKTKLQAKQLPLRLLQPLLPVETRIVGKAALQAELSTEASGRMTGAAELQIPAGKLDFALGATREEVDFSDSGAKAVIDRKGLDADINLPLQQLGGFAMSLQLPGIDLTDLKPDQQSLQGRIKGGVQNLAMLTAFSPQLQNSRGELSVDMTLGGSLSEPRIDGDAKLTQGAIDIPVLGIELRDMEMSMQTPDLETISLAGSVRSGKGRLALEGTTRMDADNGYPSKYKIEGKDWLVVNIPEAEVRLSPNLSFEHNAQKSVLEGKVHLPYARIRPRALPETAVSESSDLVVVGGDEAQQAQPDTPLHAKVRLSLGKRVSFDGLGLRGKLTGGLMIIDEPGRPVIGRGRLGISEGVYQAYGQDLNIERGYALFADSPVDNPGLDVRAAREVDEITAGMRITGTLKKPHLKLYSTPSMSETDILSYIVTGRPAGESSGKTAGMLAMMQASGASNIASELGRQLGLEELRVETGSSLEEAALVAGTYLSPRLYVQYVNELATGETKVRMRYDLTDRWQLEAETGRTQSGDFFYTFDR